GRWPELMAALVARAVQRSHTLALQTAICHLQRVETRLLLLLGHLAGRGGEVAADGLVVPLELTHRTLAPPVGARRPTGRTAARPPRPRRCTSGAPPGPRRRAVPGERSTGSTERSGRCSRRSR